MKKIIHLVFIALLCPILMGAVSQEGYFPVPQDNTNTTDQTLNLNSGMFGLHGPFELGLQYSKEFGYMLTGKFTQLLTQLNAVSLGLEAGTGQRRANLTLGHAFNKQNRVKASVEYLTQNMDFNFASGTTDQWVGQPAYGVTYEYLPPIKFIHDFNLNAFYSHAISKTLSNRIYTTNSGTFENFRHIAGATDKSTSAGIDLLPFKNSLVGLQLNYDNVHYNTRYADNDAQNASGLGATVSLDQLINKHLKLKLLASDRKPYQDYQAGLGWLLKSKPGTKLELQLLGERIIGQTGTDNDTRTGLNLAYSWGGSTKSGSSTYSIAPKDGGDLANWTSKPAVHMEQVLAVRDEKSVELNGNQLQNPVQGRQGTNVILVHLKEPVDIHLDKYFKTMVSNNTKVDYAVKGLPSQLIYKNGELVGEFKHKKAIGDYHVTVQQNVTSLNNDHAMKTLQPTNGSASVPLLIKVAPANYSAPTINPAFQPGTQHAATGQPFTFGPKQAFAGVSGDPNVMFVDPEVGYWGGKLDYFNDGDINSRSWQEGGLSGTGLQAVYHKVTGDATKDTFEIIGTPTQQNQEYNVKVRAHSVRGWSDIALPLMIKIIVGKVNDPTFNPDPPTSPSYHVGDTDTKQLTVVSAGQGETFKDASAVTIKPVGGSGYTPGHFGLTMNVAPSGDRTQATVTFSGTAKNPGSQQYQLTAINERGGETISQLFTLVVSPAVASPTITPHLVDHFIVGSPLPVGGQNLADVTAGSGTLTSVTVNGAATWTGHGITVTATKVTDTTYKLMATGTPTDPTFTEETLKFDATNSDKQSTTYSFALNIAGPPVWQKDLDPQTVAQTTSIIPVDLTPIFKNPTKSGTVTYTITQPTGFHLSVTGDQLSGTVDATATVGENTVTVAAANTEGSAAKSAMFKVTVTTATAPVITPHPVDHFTVGTPLPAKGQNIADITAGTGTLTSVTVNSGATWAGHGITVTVTKISDTQYQMIATGTPTDPTFTEETLKFDATNSATKTATANFALNVADVPGWQKDPDAQTVAQGLSITPVDLTPLFKNPTKSGALTYPITQPTGFNLSVSGTQLTGTIDSTVTPGDYKVTIGGHNDIGDATKGATLMITVTKATAPTIATHPFDFQVGTPLPAGGQNLADVSTTTGTLTSVTINGAATWTGHGITVTATKVSDTSYQMMATGTPTDPTFSEETLKFDATNSASKSTSANFAVNVKGTPVWQQDPTAQTVRRGTSVTPVDLSPLFKNPTKSGTLTYPITQPSGFHLSISGTTLSGTIDPSVKPDHYTVTIGGHNDIGDATKSATFAVTVILPSSTYYLTPATGAKVGFDDSGHPTETIEASASQSSFIPTGEYYTVTSTQIYNPKYQDQSKYPRKFIYAGIEGNKLRLMYQVQGYLGINIVSEQDLPNGAKFVNRPGSSTCTSSGNPDACQIQYPVK